MILEKIFEVRWADLDPNFHLRHSVYADYCASLRMSVLESLGFGFRQFMKYQIGPVLFQENITYIKEVPPGSDVRVTMKIGGLSSDSRKFRICHEIYRQSDGELSARLEVMGAWMDTVKRKITVPPDELLKVMENYLRTEDFHSL